MLRLAKSPYVLKVFNYDENNDSYLMEKCDCNVYDYLENNPFKDDKLILQVIEELLLGMKDVHEAGIIHRDLHLGNILIKEGHVVLSDFGLSKDTMINHSLKSTSTPKNSHYFIDPIGLHDFTALDKLSDIYSIGKIIDYITGESELNKKLSFVISKATERNRTKRYAAVDELIQDVNSSVKEISEEEKAFEEQIAQEESPKLQEISEVCRRRGLYLYMDGARLGYGLCDEGNDLDLPAIASLCDAFYIGGTKVGALFGEALVLRHDALKEDFRYIAKQKGGRLAKGRLLGIQFLELFRDGLYFRLGAHADRLAVMLRDFCRARGLALPVASGTNQQFVTMPDSVLDELGKKYGFAYLRREGPSHSTVRFCTSWATREEDVRELMADIGRLC